MARAALTFTVGLALVFTVATQLLFTAGLIISYTYALLALVLSSIGALAVTFMVETLDRRLEYAAIGDTTSTASRLEGMTRGTPFQLCIPDSTHEALTRKPDDLQFVGEFEVRGRLETVNVWGLVEDGARSDGPPESLIGNAT